MTEINWGNRLIAIKGTRGVGKTTFLLQYARDNFEVADRDCLYINLNHFYFTTCSIFDFATSFVSKGGRILLLDQIYKYPDWSEELKQCYDCLPNLQIAFTGSTVLDLESDEHIAKVVDIYNLRGFSYREFLNISLGLNLKSYTLDELISSHQLIAKELSADIEPYQLLWDYMHHGYYPFFLEKKNFSENLLKMLNMMLEVDVLSIKQIELSYLPKLRKLLYLLASLAPVKPNISSLSIDCDISRATVTNYLEYLKSARLINMLYKEGQEFPKKPDMVYMHNTNILFPMRLSAVDAVTLNETFFYNQVHHCDCSLNMGARKGEFIVKNKEKEYRFKFDKNRKKKENTIYVSVDKIIGDAKTIPIWLFGFLY